MQFGGSKIKQAAHILIKMSYYPTADEYEQSMELLPEKGDEVVPETEPESTFAFAGNENDDDSSLSDRSGGRVDNKRQKVSGGVNHKTDFLSFNHKSRHENKKVVSPDRRLNKIYLEIP